MDVSQTNHLKAYGVVFNEIKTGGVADWLLNYKGGSFLLNYSDELVLKCQLREIQFTALTQSEVFDIYSFVQSEEQNMDVMRLEKAPRIAVYVTPGHKPWDDAVTLALEYAEVEYDKIWIEEILAGKLSDYDWLHLHHEDFTGQYGKFYASFGGADWYRAQQSLYESMAGKTGHSKVSQMELDVVKEIKRYVIKGGFLFAMCSGTDSFDIALAADETDIVDKMYDGDPSDNKAQEKLNFDNTLAFHNFKVEMNPYVYEFSNIDIPLAEIGDESNDYFTLFDFSAKYDPVPTMLTQNHVNVIRGFMGQTTMFRKELIKSSVVILAEREGTNQVRYIHGNLGRGTFTFYGGHDPEDYKHYVGAPPTDLSLHKTSPGYRLILNNILFPAAKKKKQKT
ncbi:MAG: asparagine synthetase B [Rhodothermaceae bacterium]